MLCSISTTQTHVHFQDVQVGRLSWKGCRCRLSPTSSPPSTGSNLGPLLKKPPHSPSSSLANLASGGEGLTRRRKSRLCTSFHEGGMGRGTPPMKEQTESGERGRAGGEAAPAATWQTGRGQGTKGKMEAPQGLGCARWWLQNCSQQEPRELAMSLSPSTPALSTQTLPAPRQPCCPLLSHVLRHHLALAFGLHYSSQRPSPGPALYLPEGIRVRSETLKQKHKEPLGPRGSCPFQQHMVL